MNKKVTGAVVAAFAFLLAILGAIAVQKNTRNNIRIDIKE